jgi:RNA polymerase sigma-70 factor (ECF subfamily)
MCGMEEAEEITQEVFIRVMHALPKFRGQSSIKTWLYRIAANYAIDRSRSREYKTTVKKTIYNEDIINSSAYKDLWSRMRPDSQEREIIKTEMIDCIARYINEMNPNFRNIIILGELENRTNKEIAQILQITVENVKIRLVRARKQLRKILSENCSISYNEDNLLHCDGK